VAFVEPATARQITRVLVGEPGFSTGAWRAPERGNNESSFQKVLGRGNWRDRAVVDERGETLIFG
jgi:hypothetical protein